MKDVIGIIVPKHKDRYPVKVQQQLMDMAGIKARELSDKGRLPRGPDDFSRMSCPDRTYAIQWLFMVCIERGPAEAKRKIIIKFVDDVISQGGIIWELGSNRRTDDPAQRRAMLADALTAVTKGRQPALTHQRGRPKKVFTADQLEKAKIVWESRKLKTWDDVAAALPKGMTVHNAWRQFGARDRTD
jgi:hypothetical protein